MPLPIFHRVIPAFASVGKLCTAFACPTISHNNELGDHNSKQESLAAVNEFGSPPDMTDERWKFRKPGELVQLLVAAEPMIWIRDGRRGHLIRRTGRAHFPAPIVPQLRIHVSEGEVRTSINGFFEFRMTSEYHQFLQRQIYFQHSAIVVPNSERERQ
jgi:hypothetical protein